MACQLLPEQAPQPNGSRSCSQQLSATPPRSKEASYGQLHQRRLHELSCRAAAPCTLLLWHNKHFCALQKTRVINEFARPSACLTAAAQSASKAVQQKISFVLQAVFCGSLCTHKCTVQDTLLGIGCTAAGTHLALSAAATVWQATTHGLVQVVSHACMPAGS